MAGDISKSSSGKLQCIEKYIYRAVYRNAGACNIIYYAEVVTAINHVMKKEVQMSYTLEYSVHDVIWKAPRRQQTP